jgi:DNA excision repair protein ERCC-4
MSNCGHGRPPKNRAPAKFAAEPRPEDICVVIDTREQLPVDLSPMPSEAGTLTTGDYGLKALPHVCAIERKSESDLLGCIGVERTRFEREVLRLLAYPVRGIVVESTWQRIEAGEWRSKVTPAAAMGSLLGWAAMGVPIFMVGTHERAGQFIARILYTAARREYRKLRGLLCNHGGSTP